jgi:cytoskeletal protein CcmA (bactofilin family)
MFSKSNVFNRNEPISRREAELVPASNAQPGPPKADTGTPAARNSARTPAAAPADRSPAANEPSRTPPASPPSSAAKAESPPPTESWTPSATNQAIEARLLVGRDVKLKGAEILDCDTLVVEGRVEATMDSRVIRIAENGAFIGKVSIDIAEIHGVFEGELTARSQLIVHSTGRVNGKIRYGKLVVDEGGVVCGEVNTLTEHESPQAKRMIDALVPLNAAAG